MRVTAKPAPAPAPLRVTSKPPPQPQALRGPPGTRAPRSVSSALLDALSAGASIAKSSGPEGKEQLLSAHERARLEAFFVEIPGLAERVEGLLAGLTAAAAALLLRAVHARLPRLVDDPAALAEVAGFARAIVGLDDATLLFRATVLDLDSTESTSALDPLSRALRRGVIHARGLDDASTDNDGLFQRYTGSCGPTTIQMMIAEADPITAFALHADGLHAEGPTTLAARFQRQLLERYGTEGVATIDAQRWSRFKNALGRLEVPEKDARALERYALKEGPLTPGARKVLVELRAHFDFPSNDELALLRAHPVHDRDTGLGVADLADALRRHLSPLTGVRYVERGPFARGRVWRHLDAVARALERGLDVPFGVSQPNHWMLLSAVEGEKPARRFLVSDPSGGRTAWVAEAELLSGAFLREPFKLSVGRQRGFVDTFFVPA